MAARPWTVGWRAAGQANILKRRIALVRLARPSQVELTLVDLTNLAELRIAGLTPRWNLMGVASLL